MNRRQLFLSTAKAALLTAFGGLGLTGGAKAQTPGAAATGGWARQKLSGLIGKITGTPGSPTATVNIPGDVLPPPPQPFGGVIELNAAQSQPYWPMRVVPPKGAPNILLIMTDDVGFAAPSTFGGVIPTPALDRVAANGLRYTNFHSTALCSPTRAALITGRNHHSAGFGVVTEQSTGFPGYNSVIGKDCATIGRILQGNGYRTSWFGKEHNTPTYQASQAGPFDQWPIGMGFDYFYGFLGGDASQWEPNLFRNTTAIYPYVGNPDWNLTTAMADDAIHWMKQLNDIDPEMPFFLHYVPGGTHAPHHPTPEWVKNISDMHLFDKGWNDLRDQIFANQKKLGVIPQDAQLTPWPHDILKNWDELSDDEKKLFIRQADVYGAYLAYTDHEIGRVIQAVEDLGKLDNTLIIYISGDNGASAEGGLNGTPSEVMAFNGVDVPVADQLKYFYDVWGTQLTYNHFAVPWAWAFDTPYKWTKQIPSFFGGTRQGMAISWPARITDKGGVRWQFHHVIDIVPTILEVTGIPAPDMVDGIAQKPIEGVSLAYTFDKENADAPTTHKTQYFEMFGVQGLYDDGWMLSAVPTHAPWDLTGATPLDPASAFKFELYDVRKDWTQYTDVAASHPRKVREMTDLMFGEFAKYQVLPLELHARDAPRRAEAEPDRRPQAVHLLRRAGERHSIFGGANSAQHLLHHHRRDRRAAGRRRGRDRHPGRAVRRLRALSVEGQASIRLEPARPQADQVAGARRARARQAHDHLRLQIWRPRLRHARVQQHERPGAPGHGHAFGRRQGGRDPDDGQVDSADVAVGRDLRHRL